jgi:uncharacterized protein
MSYNDSDAGTATEGHPIHTLMEEHKLLLDFAQKQVNVARTLKTKNSLTEAELIFAELSQLVESFRSSPNHYLREENVIFPILEKKGFTGPPAVMWQEHDQIRSIEKNLYLTFDSLKELPWEEFCKKMESSAIQLAQMLQTHFYKENNILFPTALELLTETEWVEVIREFERIGYCPFTPGVPKAKSAEIEPSVGFADGLVQFETGALSASVLQAIFNTLPVEITFVDAEDHLRFFSESKEPIFPRSTASLGLKVQNCHPQKSVHMVNKILEDFKSGKSDVAAFWINMQGKMIYIRYFAVRNRQGTYLGCMEVTQDITKAKTIEGEKRLL